MQPDPNVIDFYDLLAAMIERIPWKGEQELRTYRVLLARIRDINLFGYMATKTTAQQGESDVNR